MGTFKRDVRKTMAVHFLHLQDFCITATSFVRKDGLTPDVLLCLEDRNVPCHSAILRARSPLFSAFFDDDDWTKTRWEHDGTIHVQFRHLEWRHMQYVMKFIYGGDKEIFDVLGELRFRYHFDLKIDGTLEFVSSVDELIDFMLGVMSAAVSILIPSTGLDLTGRSRMNFFWTGWFSYVRASSYVKLISRTCARYWPKRLTITLFRS